MEISLEMIWGQKIG